MKKKLFVGVIAAAAAVGVGAPAASSAAKPDTACMQAGIGTLRDAGLLPTVAAKGLPIETAVSVGVTVREGADISGVPNPIPFNVVLADHRAGDNSLFVYPWCD